jgi:hypothetical protein
MLKDIYKVLPKSFKSNYSKLNYAVLNRPKVLFAQKPGILFPGSAKGGVIFSADFELGWAVRYSKANKDPVEYALRERINTPRIIKLLDDYHIPIVWATVGHLFLEKCNKGDHDMMRRIPYFDDHWKYTEGDWFDCDPYTDYVKDPSWYAPDLIEKILSADTKHEMACHTFSHIDCSYKNCPPEVIDDELKASFDAAKKWGIIFKSSTFPGGTAGNYEILKKYGIDICRKRHYDFELAYPFFNEHGLIVTPTGPGLSLGYANWSDSYRISRYKKAIDKAIKTNTIVHFWFHPSQEEAIFGELLPGILQYCSYKRDQGQLWIGTMSEISEFIRENTSQTEGKNK